MTTGVWRTLSFGTLDLLCASLGVHGLSDARVIETSEGEYAIIAQAYRDEAPVIVGLVYGDGTVEALVCEIGFARDGTARSDVEREVRAHSLALPTRPRRYLHTPPAGWSWHGDHRISIYESPDRESAIAVYPSLPGASVDEAWRVVTSGIVERGARITRMFQSTDIEVGPLRGILREFLGVTAEGEVKRWAFAALSDGFMAYPLVLSSPSNINHRIEDFANVVDSVTQLPRPFPVDAFAHWAS